MRSVTEERTVSAQKRSLLADAIQIGLDFYRYRELLYQLTLRDIRLRYKQAIMGFGWAVFMPVVVVLAGVLVRFVMARLSGVDLRGEVIAGVAVRAIPWTFFVGAVGFANTALIANQNLVTKIYFPREMLPLAAVLAQVLDSVIGATVLLVVLPFLGVTPSTTWLWVLPIAAFFFLLTSGIALFLSCANLFFRDVKYIVQVLLTFGIFFTPVFYEASMLGEPGSTLIMLNPLAPFVEGLRLAVIEGHNLTDVLYTNVGGSQVLSWSPWFMWYGLSCSLLIFGASAAVFHRLEFLFAEYV